MNTIKLKDGYRFSYRDEKNFAEKNDEPGVYYCPYCYAQVESTFQSACVSCKESFALPKEKENDYTKAKNVKTYLEENGLEKCIPILEEKKLLDKAVLSKMTESDYEKIGITEISDRKKLLVLFSKKKGGGCLIPALIFIGVIVAVIILLHFLGVLGSVVSIVKWVGIGILAIVIFLFFDLL